MDSFYNHHIPLNVKEKITEELVSVAKDQLGSALTFTLIEYLKENHERFTKSFAVDKVDTSQNNSFPSETPSVCLNCLTFLYIVYIGFSQTE